MLRHPLLGSLLYQPDGAQVATFNTRINLLTVTRSSCRITAPFIGKSTVRGVVEHAAEHRSLKEGVGRATMSTTIALARRAAVSQGTIKGSTKRLSVTVRLAGNETVDLCETSLEA